MKKLLKNSAILLIIAVMLILLTGCGSNKLVATKTTQDDFVGNYKEEIIMTFKNDKVNTIEIKMEFDDEKTAEGMYALFAMAEEETTGIEVKQDGKKLVITMDSKTYSESGGIEEKDLTKAAMKASLEEDGYTVK